MNELYDHLPPGSVDQLVSVFVPDQDIAPSDEAEADPLLEACKIVAKASKLSVVLKSYHKEDPLIVRINQLAEDVQCRIRQIGLTGEWWKDDHGPLLVFLANNNHPCALIPLKNEGYQLIDPVAGKLGTKLTSTLAKELAPVGFFFYRALPDEKLTWKSLLSFGLYQLKGDIRRILILQILVGLLGLLIPISTGIIFDNVIPNAKISLLLQFIVALIVVSVSINLFEVTQALGLMRVKFKLTSSLQPAIWDRLLRLPIGFFRFFNAGNLASRAECIDEIQQSLTGAVVSSILGGFFSIITLILMFYYSYVLAIYAFLIAIIIAAINLIFNLIQLKFQRKIYQIYGILSGLMLQLFLSIGKLRIANREGASFQLWSKHFSEKTMWYRRAGYLQIGLNVFAEIIGVISTAILFWLVIRLGNRISFGDFIAFNAAYGQFFAAIFAMAGAIATSMEVIPLFERARPILHTLPEVNNAGISIKPSGKISIQTLAFRYYLAKPLDYSDDILPESSTPGPWIFRNFNLEINPGEFVALVGPSGAGKSTIFRLLLGFEKPEKGLITYDNYDLGALNHHHLRSHLGVVLQNSTLFPGTIIDNLRSTCPLLSLDEAFELLEQVQFAEDLEMMPMGLATLLSEGGTNLSTGQRQRLLIAKAIAHRPLILLLDEATSALDNQTQTGVYQFIERLKMTRIVAAHRLSTIQHADRIYVLDGGDVIQCGNYHELIQQQDGLFYQLVQRQRY